MDLLYLKAIGLLELTPPSIIEDVQLHCLQEDIPATAAAAAKYSGEGNNSDEDTEPLFTVDSGIDGTLSIPSRQRNAFFDASFAVTSLKPSFDVELVLLGPGGMSIGQDVSLRAMSVSTAHRIAAELSGLSGIPISDFLRARDPDGSELPARARDVPSVAALKEVFRVAVTSGARVELAEGLADPQEAVCCYFDALCELLHPTVSEFSALISTKEVLPSIYSVEAASSFVLGSMFLRPQEYYECPNKRFRHQRFTLEEYKAWCRDSDDGGDGAFHYYVKWPGFNVPSWVLDDLRRGVLGELRPQEKALLTCLEGCTGHYYVIGTMEQDPSTLRHELAHGLYFVSSAYRESANSILAMLSPAETEGLNRKLLSMGYVSDPEILADEMQAYMVEGDSLGCNRPDVLKDLATLFQSSSPPR